MRRGVDGERPKATAVPIRFPRRTHGVFGKMTFLEFAERGREVDECSMSRSEADERMIYDEEVIPIQILFDGGLAKFAQAAPVPLDIDFWMLRFVFGNTSQSRGRSRGDDPR